MDGGGKEQADAHGAIAKRTTNETSGTPAESRHGLRSSPRLQPQKQGGGEGGADRDTLDRKRWVGDESGESDRKSGRESTARGQGTKRLPEECTVPDNCTPMNAPDECAPPTKALAFATIASPPPPTPRDRRSGAGRAGGGGQGSDARSKIQKVGGSSSGGSSGGRGGGSGGGGGGGGGWCGCRGGEEVVSGEGDRGGAKAGNGAVCKGAGGGDLFRQVSLSFSIFVLFLFCFCFICFVTSRCLFVFRV